MTFKRIRMWVDSASTRSKGEESRVSERTSVIAADLEGLSDSANRIRKLLSEMLNREPKRQHLEDFVVRVEVEMEHMSWHYKSISRQLDFNGTNGGPSRPTAAQNMKEQAGRKTRRR